MSRRCKQTFYTHLTTLRGLAEFAPQLADDPWDFRQTGARVVKRQDIETVAGIEHAEQGRDTRYSRRRFREAITLLAPEHGGDPHDIQFQIARAATNDIAGVNTPFARRLVTQVHAGQTRRKVHPTVHRKRQGPPDTPVNLHQPRAVFPYLKLDHRQPCPAQRLQQPDGIIVKRWVEGDAFAKRARAPRYRHFTQSPVLKGGRRRSVAHEQLNAVSLALKILLQQHRAAAFKLAHAFDQPGHI